MNSTVPRVALSFNYAGGCGGKDCWARTADVAAAFPKGTLGLRSGATSMSGSREQM